MTTLEKAGLAQRCSQHPAVIKQGRWSDRRSDSIFFDAIISAWSDLGGSLRLPHPESDTRNDGSGGIRLPPTPLVVTVIQWHRRDSFASATIRRRALLLFPTVGGTGRAYIEKLCAVVKIDLNKIRKLPRTEPHSDQIRLKFALAANVTVRPSEETVLPRHVSQSDLPGVSTREMYL
jgi:hypothetical protein